MSTSFIGPCRRSPELSSPASVRHPTPASQFSHPRPTLTSRPANHECTGSQAFVIGPRRGKIVGATEMTSATADRRFVGQRSTSFNTLFVHRPLCQVRRYAEEGRTRDPLVQGGVWSLQDHRYDGRRSVTSDSSPGPVASLTFLNRY